MDEEGLEFFEGLKATIWPKSITFRTLDKVAEKRKLMDQGIKKIKVSHGFSRPVGAVAADPRANARNPHKTGLLYA